MVKLGELKKRKEWERISFRDWVMRGYARDGRYQVRVIFPPNKFPSWTLVFEDEGNGFEVRLSLKSEKMKEALKALGIELRKTDFPQLVIEIEGEGTIYGLDIEKQANTKLAWKGSYWVRKSLNDPWEGLEDNF